MIAQFSYKTTTKVKATYCLNREANYQNRKQLIIIHNGIYKANIKSIKIWRTLDLTRKIPTLTTIGPSHMLISLICQTITKNITRSQKFL